MKRFEANHQAQQCAEFIKEAKNIVALTGAGISTAAGIPDFRGPDGLYSLTHKRAPFYGRKYDPEKVFDINYFYSDPLPFFDFARDLLHVIENVKPTFTHHFLAELEKQGKLKGIITQNIDALHHQAGSKKVYEMHGSIWKGYCLESREEFSYEQLKEKILKEKIPRSFYGGVIKPDIVFFGENVKYFAESIQLAERADLFFIIGSSCVVQPAASLSLYTKGKIIVVNKGNIDLPMGAVTMHVEDDIDIFFKNVAKCLTGQG